MLNWIPLFVYFFYILRKKSSWNLKHEKNYTKKEQIKEHIGCVSLLPNPTRATMGLKFITEECQDTPYQGSACNSIDQIMLNTRHIIFSFTFIFCYFLSCCIMVNIMCMRLILVGPDDEMTIVFFL